MFNNMDFLRDDEICMRLYRTTGADRIRDFAPSFAFKICSLKTGEEMGECDLRIGHNENLYYGGNIGYHIFRNYQGNHYAGKACRLLFKLARVHNLEYVIITCNPDNLASRKTCEYVGCMFERIVDLPPWNDMYIEGERQKCIYRYDL